MRHKVHVGLPKAKYIKLNFQSNCSPYKPFSHLCLLNSTTRDEKTIETELSPVCLALTSIAGKWFAEKQLAILTLLVSISLGDSFNLSLVPISGDN